jgi:phosphonate transport system substrate-binding protein
MKQFTKTIILTLGLPLFLYSHVANSGSLALGVFPYLTAEQLVQFHTPLRNYLSKSLGQEVNLVTSPDFSSFNERTHKGEYDIVLTAPHLGRLAETRDGYHPLVMASQRVQGIFLVKKVSAINSLEDLKDKKIMLIQRGSLIYQMVQQTLAAKGLQNGENITLVETKTHNNALYAPLRNDADAAVIDKSLWKVLGQEYKSQLKIIGHTTSVPGVIILANPKIEVKIQQKIQNALLNFRKTKEGKAYFIATGEDDFLPATTSAMKELDPYITIFTESH